MQVSSVSSSSASNMSGSWSPTLPGLAHKLHAMSYVFKAVLLLFYVAMRELVLVVDLFSGSPWDSCTKQTTATVTVLLV